MKVKFPRAYQNNPITKIILHTRPFLYYSAMHVIREFICLEYDSHLPCTPMHGFDFIALVYIHARDI